MKNDKEIYNNKDINDDIANKVIGPGYEPEDEERMIEQAAKRSAEALKEEFIEKPKRDVVGAIEELGKLAKQERISSKTQEIFNKTYDFLKEYGQDKNTFYKVLTPGVEFWKYFEDKIDGYEFYLSSPHKDSIEKSLEKENCEIKLKIGDAKDQNKIERELYPVMAVSIKAKEISIWRPKQRFEGAKEERADELDLLKVEEIIDGLINKKHFNMTKAKGAGDAGGAGSH